MSKRTVFFLIFLATTAIETIIALFVRDAFFRPYFGDFLIVIVIWAFARALFPVRLKFMPLIIFLFACAVEFAQYFDYAKLLGAENNEFISTLLGNSFSWLDILCYAAGCAVIFGIETLMRRGSRTDG